MNKRPIRIANCSGFFGDRMSALAEVVSGGPVDVVTGDYLAEVTMTILAKQRRKNPELGYVPTFLGQLPAAMGTIVQKGIKVVVNAGGLNPTGLASALRTCGGEVWIEAEGRVDLRRRHRRSPRRAPRHESWLCEPRDGRRIAQ